VTWRLVYRISRRPALWPRLFAACCLTLATAAPVLAEFEIQESTIDPGEIQLQYRGAWHEGLPSISTEEADDDALLPADEEAPLRQSHEAELQMSVTTHWLLAVTHGFEQAADDTLKLTSIEAETQVELITLEGEGLGLAVQGGVEQPVLDARDDEAGDYHFGPIVELAKDKFLLTLNPLFYKERGDLAEQDGWGFEYGWQLRYVPTPKLWLTVEMFGEVEDMANAGSFAQQVHSIGPAFYYIFGADDDVGGETEEEGSAELTLSLGAQFGLTEEASDVALKVFIGYEFF
jgi:hypothetical protein